MTNQTEMEAQEGSSRRFDVQLLITHPTLDPAEITNALGLQPCSQHRAGTQRRMPVGRPLEGFYLDTRWRHSVRHEVRGQWFATQVTAFVDQLMARRNFLTNLQSTGGKATVIIQFLGDGYFGDELSREILARIVELDLTLAVECFLVPQS